MFFSNLSKPPTYIPGECTSVDQIESSTPGFISQLKVKPTKHHYCAAKIFLDHYSDFTYLHMQRELSPDKTVQSKKVFEAYARTYRVRIKK